MRLFGVRMPDDIGMPEDPWEAPQTETGGGPRRDGNARVDDGTTRSKHSVPAAKIGVRGRPSTHVVGKPAVSNRAPSGSESTEASQDEGAQASCPAGIWRPLPVSASGAGS